MSKAFALLVLLLCFGSSYASAVELSPDDSSIIVKTFKKHGLYPVSENGKEIYSLAGFRCKEVPASKNYPHADLICDWRAPAGSSESQAEIIVHGEFEGDAFGEVIRKSLTPAKWPVVARSYRDIFYFSHILICPVTPAGNRSEGVCTILPAAGPLLQQLECEADRVSSLLKNVGFPSQSSDTNAFQLTVKWLKFSFPAVPNPPVTALFEVNGELKKVEMKNADFEKILKEMPLSFLPLVLGAGSGNYFAEDVNIMHSTTADNCELTVSLE